ncbi:deoxyribodipyrimidine photo-lyase [Paenibacillus sp. SYP-B3998]|uniref:Deoxyribodipyrimidine photo-lyase n=1 Tax=Paenibacillus sp. SYP-B3998 TaxID=2678564 RepID=A0A6G3ZZQ0_9BACL|nr:deoxyribodipyrimidine photo-lyase [Paenibacillus sp. SYP-B3998]
MLYGDPAIVLKQVLQAVPVNEVVMHRDFTPYAKARDQKLKEVTDDLGIPLTLLVDHTLADLIDFQRTSGKN